MAACQSSSAEALLLEMLRTTSPQALWYPELVRAVGAYRSPAAFAALLEALLAAGRTGGHRATFESRDALVRVLGLAARENPGVLASLHARARESTDSGEREHLAAVLREAGGDAAAIAVCDLVLDAAPIPIPWGVRELVGEAIHRREPADPGGSWYVIPRAAPELRARLFELLNTDAARKEGARQLLLSIEADRIETGRPSDETRYPGTMKSTPVVAIWPLS
jgi:hypothetical protein